MLIVLSGDVEMNSGYHHVEDLKDIKGNKNGSPKCPNAKHQKLRLESETWLNEPISDTEIRMLGYSVVRKQGRRDRGAMPPYG